MTAVLPPARVAIAGNAPPSREWYRYFQASTQVNLDVGTLRHDVGALTVRVTALEDAPPSSGDTKITGTGSIYVSATAVKVVSLEGDAEDPGFTTYYGTDATGAKGWYAVSDALDSSGNIAKSTDAAGVTSFDLVDLADSGTGTALVKIIRDAKGRVSGTSAATTTDLAEGDNLYFTDARADARITLQKAQPLGLATLDAAGKLDAGQLPALAITETFVVNTQAAMLALSAQEGDVAVRTDLSKSFILTAAPPSTLANWQELLVPTAGVTSFNGRTGSVTPASGDYTPAQVGLGNVDNTSDLNKPVSTAQAAADAAKLSKTGDSATGDYDFSGGLLKIDSVNLRIGINNSSPKRSVHLVGSDGSVPVFPSAVGTRNFLVLENNGNCNLAFVANGDCGFFAYTSGGTLLDGSFQYNTTSKKASFFTDGSIKLTIDAVGNAYGGTDNSQTMGSASLRWSVLYAGTGSINTSDAREKTDVAPLTAAELSAAADLSRAIGTYQWLAMVADKGADAARHHAGLTVQRAIAIMQSHGLDPFRYGFICYDQWDESPEVVTSWPAQDAVLDDAGNVITPAVEAGSEITQEYRPAGDRYSFRHDELLLFIARGFAARLDALETAR